MGIRKKGKRPSAFVPRIVWGVAAGVVPLIAVEACTSDSTDTTTTPTATSPTGSGTVVALAMASFDSSADSPGVIALAMASFDAAADADADDTDGGAADAGDD